mgnify:FL=1|jgi:hypothetical protein
MYYITIMNTQPLPSSTNIEVPESVQSMGDNIGQSFNNISQSVNSSLDGFSQQAEAGIDASSGFLDSNSIIAKFAFLILVIIVFLFLLNLGIIAIQYFMNPSDSPFLVDGLIDGNKGMIITQDPKLRDSIPIKRSNNQESGIECTWSTWIRIDELKSGTEINKYQHIFHKGNNEYDENGIAKVNNAPGLYIKQVSPDNNANFASLKVIMSTTETGNESFTEIDDIPLKQWVNVIIRLQNTTLDVYINGTVSGRYNLTDVPFQNYYDVHVCQNNGFTGKLSSLRYYDNALNIFQISKIVSAGPNLNTLDDSQKEQKNYNYLSTSWYTSKL